MLPTGVEFTMDTLLIKDAATQLLEAVCMEGECSGFVPSCI